MKYTPAERRRIIDYSIMHTLDETVRKFGVSRNTIIRWRYPDRESVENTRRRSREAKRRRARTCTNCGGHVNYQTAGDLCINCHRQANLAPCGTRSAYQRGCRCAECRAATAAYARDRWKRLSA